MSTIPVSQVQYYTTREAPAVAIAQKTNSGSSSVSETVSTVTVPISGSSVQLNADTIQLMGMAGQLPSSNFLVNYPHTMWERDGDGNRIPVQITTVAGSSGSAATVTVKTEGDALSQAAAVIKNEVPTPVIKTQAPNPPNKSFICDICNKGFAKREHLTKHTRIHKDTKRYASCIHRNIFTISLSGTLASIVKNSSETAMSWFVTSDATLETSHSAARTVPRGS